jgi:hypothetical protein
LPVEADLGYASCEVDMDADELREILDRYAAGELSPEGREAFQRAMEKVRRTVEGVEERVARLEGEISDRMDKALSRLNRLDGPDSGEGVEEKVTRLVEEVSDRVDKTLPRSDRFEDVEDKIDRAVENIEIRVAKGEEKLRRKLDILVELDIARKIEEKLHRVVLFQAPEDLSVTVMRGVSAEKRPTVVIPPMRRSPMPAVLLGGGLLVALAAGLAAILPLFGVDVGVNLGGLPDWFTWIPAGLSACFGGGMVLRTLWRSKNDPAFRSAAKKG